MSYPVQSLGVGAWPSAEVQSVYSTAPVEWTKRKRSRRVIEEFAVKSQVAAREQVSFYLRVQDILESENIKYFGRKRKKR